MEEVLYYNNLYDIYGELLTSKEQETFRDYYQDDLSLGEIATDNNISRSAVSKTVNKVTSKLDYYEEKLGYYKVLSKLRELATKDNINEIKKGIEEILG